MCCARHTDKVNEEEPWAPKSWLDTGTEMYQQLVKNLQEFQVLVVVGSPGSGKTSSVPWATKYALQKQLGREVYVDCTVPRRQQALNMSKYLDKESDDYHWYRPTHGDIGYGVGGEASERGRYVNYYTGGYFLQLYPTMDKLGKIDALIIDECHEQSMEIDAVVELAEILLKKKCHTKIILMSATLAGTKSQRAFHISGTVWEILLF